MWDTLYIIFKLTHFYSMKTQEKNRKHKVYNGIEEIDMNHDKVVEEAEGNEIKKWKIACTSNVTT